MGDNVFYNFKYKSDKERMYSIFIFAMFLICVAYLLEIIICWIFVSPHYLLLNNSLFFQDFDDSFMDFFNVNYFVKDSDPYFAEGSSYPPLALSIAKIFSLMTDYSDGSKAARSSVGGIISLIIFFLIFIVSTYKMIEKKVGGIRAGMVYVLLFLSAQNLFLIQRGNYLCITFIFTALFVLTYDSDKRWQRELSCIFLGMATGMKLYPCAFALILLREKRFSQFFRCVFWSVVFLGAPFIFFKGGFSNAGEFIKNITEFGTKGYYIFPVDFVPHMTKYSYDYSASTFYDLMWRFIDGMNLYLNRDNFVYEHMLICALIVIISLFGSFYSEFRWQTLLFASLLTVLIPSPSFIYAGVMLFIPFISFIEEEKKRKFDYVYLCLFIIFFSPFQFGYIIPRFTEQLFYGITVSNFISLTALILMLVISFCDVVLGGIRGKEIKKPVYN